MTVNVYKHTYSIPRVTSQLLFKHIDDNHHNCTAIGFTDNNCSTAEFKLRGKGIYFEAEVFFATE